MPAVGVKETSPQSEAEEGEKERRGKRKRGEEREGEREFNSGKKETTWHCLPPLSSHAKHWYHPTPF